MKIKRLVHDFSICKVSGMSEIDFSDEIYFICKTDEELSLVCKTDHLPNNTLECVHGWKAFRIIGPLDFSLVGIMAKLSSILAAKGIGIFTASTYNTDYVFTKKENYENALSALAAAGYEIVE